MRRASFNNSIIKDDESGVFYGISLGYDYCAEHEWGIKGLKRKFGLPDSDELTNLGVINRTNTKGQLYLYENKKHVMLTSQSPWGKEEPTFENNKPYDGIWGDINTYWCDSDFCVILNRTKQNVEYLTALKNAADRKDLVIGYIAAKIPAFENSSLCVLIGSKLPKEVTDGMYYVDKKAYDLKEYEKKIGVTELKAKTRNGYKSEKYFCACSPSWINYEDAEAREKKKAEYGTKYDIMFWVNYSDDDNNYGWYKAEDIIKWLSTPGLKLKSLNPNK